MEQRPETEQNGVLVTVSDGPCDFIIITMCVCVSHVLFGSQKGNVLHLRERRDRKKQ